MTLLGRLRSRRHLPFLTLALATSVLLVGPSGTAGAAPAHEAPRETTVVHQRAHAHNDYEHARPLHDALDHGFTSVEADIWLVGGELLVAHDLEDVRPGRTLESLYLQPLTERVRRLRGSTYPGFDGTFQLLVDVKSAARPTYLALHRALQEHASVLTSYQGGRVHHRAVEVVVSGNRDLELMRSQPKRYAAYDGRLPDLARDLPAALVPLVSDNWTRNFTWQGVGPMPAAERERLHTIVEEAHAAGQRVRFWATPDQPGPARDAVWEELLDAGVDHLNTDDLAGLDAFLTARGE